MKPEPCRVGLTGGLASGKSTVARIIRGFGVPVRDADAVVHELYRTGRPGAVAATELFGPGILDASGAVDRRILAGRIFDDDGLRHAFEERIHPLVRKEISRWIAAQDTPIVVIEAALMIESGSAESYDVVVLVDCEIQQQRLRAAARGMNAAQIDATITSQATPEVRRKSVDIRIDNTGPREELPEKVRRAWKEITELCARARKTRKRGEE